MSQDQLKMLKKSTVEPHAVDTSPRWTPRSCGHFSQGPLSFPYGNWCLS